MLGGGKTLSGSFDLDLDVTGTGRTLRAVLGTASDRARFALGSFLYPDDRVNLLGKNPFGLMMTTVAKKEQGATINCAVAIAGLAEGIADVDSLTDTPDVTIRGQGRVDLARQEADFLLKPQPKRPGFASFKAAIRASGPIDALEVQADRGTSRARPAPRCCWARCRRR